MNAEGGLQRASGGLMNALVNAEGGLQRAPGGLRVADGREQTPGVAFRSRAPLSDPAYTLARC